MSKKRELIRTLLPALLVLAASLTVVAGVYGAAGNFIFEKPTYDERLVTPKGNATVSDARSFGRFPLYYAGDEFRGHPLTAVHRVHGELGPGEKVRQDEVTFLYGSCKSRNDSPCDVPLQVQVWNACERNRNVYDAIQPDEELTIRGVPAAFFEDYFRLELYTGRVTIVMFSPHERDFLLDAASKLRGINVSAEPGARMAPPAIAVYRKSSSLCVSQAQ